MRGISSILPWQILAKDYTPFGDLVVLPGKDSPVALPIDGGARFCNRCSDQDQFEQNGAYMQWPLTDKMDFSYSRLLQILPNLGDQLNLSDARNAILPVLGAPESHLNVYSDASLYDRPQNNSKTIKVVDQTGKVSTTSITNEILWLLERRDGLL